MSSRNFAPGDAYGISFTIKNTSGALAAADSLPVGSLYRNGTADGAVTVTVASSATGIYQATCTIPVGYAIGDRVSMLITATVGGVATGDFVDHVRLDALISSRLAAAGYTSPDNADIAAILAALTAGVTLADGSVTSAKFTVGSITGPATGILEQMAQVWRRFFKGSAKDATAHTIKTFADDGTTQVTSQPWTDDGAGNETLGAAS